MHCGGLARASALAFSMEQALETLLLFKLDSGGQRRKKLQPEGAELTCELLGPLEEQARVTNFSVCHH